MNESIFLDLLARKLDANSGQVETTEFGLVTGFTMDPYGIAELCLEFVKDNYSIVEVR